jgi:5-deoxy-glucuronate isomerase
VLFHTFQAKQNEPGYHLIIDRDSNHLDLLSMGMVTLTQAMPSISLDSGDNEVALVIIEGKVNVKIDDYEFQSLGDRASVFEGSATTVYVPIESSYSIAVVSDQAVIAVCCSKAVKKYKPFVVTPDEVTTVLRGKEQWRRDVRDIIVSNGEGRVDRIIVGETINYAGEWSGYPPHKHEEDRLPEELRFEEVYFYKLDPKDGFGVQVHYGSKWHEDEGYIIRDGDAFAIPDGFHPVVAAGGYRLYYLWFMAGPSGRSLTPYEDPHHRWLKDL